MTVAPSRNSAGAAKTAPAICTSFGGTSAAAAREARSKLEIRSEGFIELQYHRTGLTYHRLLKTV
jgi:hypothetical protein